MSKASKHQDLKTLRQKEHDLYNEVIASRDALIGEQEIFSKVISKCVAGSSNRSGPFQKFRRLAMSVRRRYSAIAMKRCEASGYLITRCRAKVLVPGKYMEIKDSHDEIKLNSWGQRCQNKVYHFPRNRSETRCIRCVAIKAPEYKGAKVEVKLGAKVNQWEDDDVSVVGDLTKEHWFCHGFNKEIDSDHPTAFCDRIPDKDKDMSDGDFSDESSSDKSEDASQKSPTESEQKKRKVIQIKDDSDSVVE